MPALLTMPRRFYDLTDIYDATDYDPEDESTGWDDADGETDIRTPDEDEDDEYDTPLAPTEGEPDDDRRRVGPNDGTRCPCPVLAEYPPADWLTLEQHEALDDIAGFPDARRDGNAVWVPAEICFEASLRIGCPVKTFETVFEPGYWFSFHN